jgi:PhnB protein
MAVKPIPEGWRSITPRLVVHEPAKLVEFLKHVFNGSGTFNEGRPSEIRIGDSIVMVSGVIGVGPSIPAYLYLYLDDTDAAYARALKAGALSLEAPHDLHYGDRRATIKDPAGNVWQIGTHVEDVAPDELERRLKKLREGQA